MSGWFAMLVIGIFVAWIALLLIALVGRRTTQSPLQQRVEQLRATARIRMADAQSRARAAIALAQTSARATPSVSRPPAAPSAPPAPAAAPPPVRPTPAAPLPPAWSVLGRGGSDPAARPDDDTEPASDGSSLGSSLSPSSEPLETVEPHDPIMDGPQLVPLTTDQQARVVALMEQGAEVMAVRLVCDETRAGILDAHLTVRALVGLPSPY